jgi:hypothetical protein
MRCRSVALPNETRPPSALITCRPSRRLPGVARHAELSKNAQYSHEPTARIRMKLTPMKTFESQGRYRTRVRSGAVESQSPASAAALPRLRCRYRRHRPTRGAKTRRIRWCQAGWARCWNAAWRLRLARQARRASPRRRDRTFHRASGVAAACAYLFQHHLHWLRIVRPRRSPVKWGRDSARRLGRCCISCFGIKCCNCKCKTLHYYHGVYYNNSIFHILRVAEYGHKRAPEVL